ncbi:heparan-alpha-glucosaminide N-acetyltransferase domain-containing protein [Flagellimonas allohymeniacidonis]|uniref:DUF1624 domain-containing protein n=1 Tax=Flagellimonas allohymeniacidonis TaxID=2517819 RepID=A0A4Q8QIT2_9FLAO|nr:heparan-alpha-glucosaminide N-acetyltransferase domain-containing protein [Allomuricauda hymeniacidonis]TAI48349.1 DUF1624 domain-containing protein [Allomuricauda hymeniacidonis]
MKKKEETERLYFIDAIRTGAILMMLQGHFVAALLADVYRDKGNLIFSIWSYLRGITAPLFFTVSGFIFTFLLVRDYHQGFSNPRVKKGFVRGVQLMVIGYLLQIRLSSVYKGSINNSYDIVHVLQCLGLSIILILVVYLVFFKLKKTVFSLFLCSMTILLFAFKSSYEQWDYSLIPDFFSNYFTKANGSVFTIAPWFGFVSFGSFLAVIFANYHKRPNFYRYAIITIVCMGFVLVANSYEIIRDIKELTGLQFFQDALQNAFLFARLGIVLFVFALFMLFRHFFKNKPLLRIGQNTLPIYVLHSVVLYGSITGFGLSRFFYHSLSPTLVVLGAIIFVVFVSAAVIKVDGKVKIARLWFQ